MNRRKRKLVRTDLQFKVVFSTLFVATFVLLVNFLLLSASTWTLSAKNGDSLKHSDVRAVVLTNFTFCLILALPLSVTVGILYSFKFSGPIYRFKRYFTEVAQGQWAHRCGLRKGDLLVDLSETINAGMDCVRERLRENHELIRDLAEVVESGVSAADGSRLEDLRSRVSKELEEYERHLATAPVAPEEGAEGPAVRGGPAVGAAG